MGEKGCVIGGETPWDERQGRPLMSLDVRGWRLFQAGQLPTRTTHRTQLPTAHPSPWATPSYHTPETPQTAHTPLPLGLSLVPHTPPPGPLPHTTHLKLLKLHVLLDVQALGQRLHWHRETVRQHGHGRPPGPQPQPGLGPGPSRAVGAVGAVFPLTRGVSLPLPLLGRRLEVVAGV